MTTSDSHPHIAAILVSVGGAPAPVLHVLRRHRPAHVWYFCSAGSRATADEIHATIARDDPEWRPERDIIEVGQFEELGPCYRDLRRAIPSLLAKWSVHQHQVLVDYTGGTKTMTAALVLAASEWFQQFSYVGGAQREKGGLGIVVDGKERMLYQGNPWTALAIREVERARDLWAGCQFDTAGGALRDVAPKVPHRLRFEALADLAAATAARHRLDFSESCELLSRLLGKLPSLFDGRDDCGLLDFVRHSHNICRACTQQVATDALLRELLDNALRTAAQGRFEDAAARLYRAIEMQGQLWLAEATDGLFRNGQCQPDDLKKLPPALTDLPSCQPGKDGRVKLSLEDCFCALATLGHERAVRIFADLNAKNASGKPRSRLRAATEKRNASILAHGVQPVGRDGFETMKAIARDFLGFEIDQEANPIRPLDPRWLDA
ncbi:MAG: TIGR02710 family CRISPR-associated protein [Verrucomicrobia bacterium]|jgi:CRISPR-associated protein (TIGR02710 family)|nr:TIGR02710 family CRISPR-associated protein [Verrucomicrobiota bacterium]OQC62443.1 MAG: CRISPR-associated protein (Cas_Cas02710) [Verrucomicrobia bacterium ADurb.Bin006]MDI9379752.1 TIGR02710 family CRISPR-associated CARF protein [Verrucomicrobiota bacterium]NMD21279.1 TIGR02710 family CRISPR-associated protein [Verrucomicrobiota bacterium]HOA62203.1 TIGR02710 family CRISPR-associated CARF protein [Verrucomicrobiota bacterium]